MSSTRPLEQAILFQAEEALKAAVADVPLFMCDEARMQVLEATAALFGGFDYQWYSEVTTHGTFRSIVATEVWARRLHKTISAVPVHHALVLSALARPDRTHSERRAGGVYYTDFRLAQYLAAPLKGYAPTGCRVLDPASGTGILLVAATLALADNDPGRLPALLADSIYGADLDPRALRGAALALSSLTDDQEAIERLLSHLRQGDSLVKNGALWKDIAPDGFEVVIGNPPWEKLKVSRHELLAASGDARHYGAEYDEDFPDEALTSARKGVSEYVADLKGLFERQGKGERDLYKLFTELAIKLARPGGHVLFLVPAGLIRSLGTQPLREFLLEKCSGIEFTLLDNRARFFAIDTRFKFLALHAQISEGAEHAPISLITATGTTNGVCAGKKVNIDRATLCQIRPDLTVPEVRSEAEWTVFQHIALNGDRFGDPDGVWRPAIMREVDMTNDKKRFLKTKKPGTVPVIEGRMLHQFRHAVKSYVSGTGRSAVWSPVPASKQCQIKPQFWFPEEMLPEQVRERVDTSRVGFCDITGQTNERTMLASRIPAGAVCGNKVPTIVFDSPHPQRHMADYWLAVVNSVPFDWLLRRVVTTTVNFFLLLDLPLPKIDPVGLVALRLASLANALGACAHDRAGGDGNRESLWAEAEIRAEIDWQVLHAFGHGLETMTLMLDDFPLIDRSQPPLKGEKRSTITHDFLFLRTAEALGEGTEEQKSQWQLRVETARKRGAVPYVPSHLDGKDKTLKGVKATDA